MCNWCQGVVLRKLRGFTLGTSLSKILIIATFQSAHRGQLYRDPSQLEGHNFFNGVMLITTTYAGPTKDRKKFASMPENE